jgi:peptide/nickel transport system ATP-binding protein
VKEKFLLEDPVLQIHGLTVRYAEESCNAVHNVDLTLGRGESVGLIGESGSGKSSLALAAIGLIGKNAQIQGTVKFRETDLTRLPDTEMNNYRWNKIAIVFQNSLDVLNPVLSVAEQIAEGIQAHLGESRASAAIKAEKYLEMVGLEAHWGKAYPHQLSGGMRQKVLIAMALSCKPEVLLIDEPTMALDAVSKQEIIRLLLHLQEEKGFSMLVISHELPVISSMTSRVLVMYAGNIVEEGGTEELLKNPLHPYTRGLISSSPAINPFRDMWGIPGELIQSGEGQCPFYNRCTQRIERCACEHPVLETVHNGRRVSCIRGGIVTILKGNDLSKHYKDSNGTITACSNCNIEVREGEVCALIGESGSGKTTMAEILSGILPPCGGNVEFDGQKVRGNNATSRAGGIQIVFQDPLSSTNEQMTIGEIVREPLDINNDGTKDERISAVKTALKNVQLPYHGSFLKKRGFMLSGGQRQRVAIARALVMRPNLLIADEISAMLDPSTAANLLRLLKGLQNSIGFAMLYITHDISLVQKIADRVYVMRNGKILEEGPVEDVMFNPTDEYTKLLLQGLRCAQWKITETKGIYGIIEPETTDNHNKVAAIKQ